MELTSTDYRAIAECIETGDNYIEYPKADDIICITCTLEVEGYEENDYFNGTGDFIVTSKSLYVKNVESYDGEGRDVPNDFDEGELFSWVE